MVTWELHVGACARRAFRRPGWDAWPPCHFGPTHMQGCTIKVDLRPFEPAKLGSSQPMSKRHEQHRRIPMPVTIGLWRPRSAFQLRLASGVRAYDICYLPVVLAQLLGFQHPALLTCALGKADNARRYAALSAPDSSRVWPALAVTPPGSVRPSGPQAGNCWSCSKTSHLA